MKIVCRGKNDATYKQTLGSWIDVKYGSALNFLPSDSIFSKGLSLRPLWVQKNGDFPSWIRSLLKRTHEICPQAVENGLKLQWIFNSSKFKNSRWKNLEKYSKGFKTDVSFLNGNSIVWQYRIAHSPFMFTSEQHFSRGISIFLLSFRGISLWIFHVQSLS